MPNKLQVILRGGPLDGRVHEINDVFGLGVPGAMGLRDDDDSDERPKALHWYNVGDGEDDEQLEAHFDRTEPK